MIFNHSEMPTSLVITLYRSYKALSIFISNFFWLHQPEAPKAIGRTWLGCKAGFLTWLSFKLSSACITLCSGFCACKNKKNYHYDKLATFMKFSTCNLILSTILFFFSVASTDRRTVRMAGLNNYITKFKQHFWYNTFRSSQVSFIQLTIFWRGFVTSLPINLLELFISTPW